MAAAEAVARSNDLVHAELLSDEADHRIENGINDLWSVPVQKVCEVVRWVIEVGWGRCAVEHVWGDRQISSTTKAIRQPASNQIRYISSLSLWIQHMDRANSQFVLRQLNAKSIGQVEHSCV